MFLSILLPSKRKEGLESFLRTFRANTKDMSDIEIIVLIDDSGPQGEYVSYHENVTVIHKPPSLPVSVGNMFEECYKLAKGRWIFFANDDIKMTTFNWDEILRKAIAQYPDEMALFWPNDERFRATLSCFPIVSKKVLDAIEFFPTPYRRYKVDDTIFSVFPFNRRIFLPEITCPHSNPIYKQLTNNPVPDDDGAVAHDNAAWLNNASKREQMKKYFSFVRRDVKVLIGASTGETPRRADFYDYMNMLEKPEGTVLMYSHERSPAAARNQIIQQSLELGCTHVLIVDDDQAFQPNALSQLLEHDVEIVSGLYLGRAWPHRPLIFDFAEDNGRCRYYTLNGDESRLIPIVAAGFGFVLMRTDIFSKMEKPWVRLGELDPQEWCDDIGFFKRAREAGIKSYCDMECRIGHIGTMIVWPDKADKDWVISYDTGSGKVNIPLGNLHGLSGTNR